MGASLYHGPGEREITLAAAYDSGDILLSADGKACVITANQRTASGDKVRALCEGVVKVDAIEANTFSAGALVYLCHVYTSDAADEGLGVDRVCRRINKIEHDT